jgi:glycerol-3-phosphate dehydrogenase
MYVAEAALCSKACVVEVSRVRVGCAADGAAAAQIVYYDGQFNDSRFNVALALTAAVAGATVLNYAAVEAFLKVRHLVEGLG